MEEDADSAKLKQGPRAGGVFGGEHKGPWTLAGFFARPELHLRGAQARGAANSVEFTCAAGISAPRPILSFSNMSINENWNIRSRSHTCTHSGQAFTDGETFYTALFEDPVSEELVRRDYSLASWDALKGELHPFSFWKSVYEAPHSEAKVEVVEKENAEGLLRRLVEDDAPGTENTRYILAIMLERKKILKHTATRETEDANFLIYEHPKTGEVYLIRDPELRLDQVDAVQREVTLLLTHGAHAQVADGTPVESGPSPAAEPEAPAEEVATVEVTDGGAVEEPESNVETPDLADEAREQPAEAEDSTICPDYSADESSDPLPEEPEEVEEPEEEMELVTNVEEEQESPAASDPVTDRPDQS